MRVGRPKMSGAKAGRSWSLDDSLSASSVRASQGFHMYRFIPSTFK